MFLTHVKHTIVEAVKRTFDETYVNTDFQGINVGIEFPVESVDYPGIWVDFEPTQQLRRAGVAHVEHPQDPDTGQFAEHTRWTFAGYSTFTAVALTSLERDRLADELVRVLAFGGQYAETRRFRDWIEDNPYIAVNFDFDEIAMRGFTVRQGTPWGTDDMLYEGTVQMECIGEFVASGLTYDLIPLSDVQIHQWVPEHEPEPLAGTTGWTSWE